MQENTTTVELRARAVAAETALADQKKDLLLHKKKVRTVQTVHVFFGSSIFSPLLFLFQKKRT